MNLCHASLAGLLALSGLASADPALRPATAAERAAMGVDAADMPLLVREGAIASRGEVALDPAGGSSAPTLTRSGIAFNGRTSAFAFSTVGNSLVCTGSSEPFATATLDLPDQAQIIYVDTFGFDTSTSKDLTTHLLSVCLPSFAAGTPVLTNLGSVSSGGGANNFFTRLDLSAAPVTVDNYTCRYLARVRMAEGGCAGSSIMLDKVRVTYTQP